MSHNEINNDIFRSFLEKSSDPVLLTDFELTVIYVNHAACKKLGRDVEELTNHKLSSLISPGISTSEIQKAEEPFIVKCTVRSEIAGYISTNARITPFSSEHNKFFGIYLHEPGNKKSSHPHLRTEDIHLSLVKRNIASITNTLHLDTLLQTILQNLVDLIDADTGIVLLKKKSEIYIAADYENHGVSTISRSYPLDEGLVLEINENQEPVSRSIEPDDNSAINRDLISRGINSYYAVPITLEAKLEGILIAGWCRSHTLTETETTLVEIVSVYCSIAILNSKLFEETRKLKEDLEIRFRRMPVGCIIWNRDLSVESWNPEAENIFGYSSEEAQGKDVFELLVPEEMYNEMKSIHRKLLDGNHTEHREARNRTKGGREIYCEWSSTPLKDKDGNVYGIISMVKDITEKKELYTVLKDKLDELSKKSGYEEAIRNISSGVHSSINLQQVLDNTVELISTNTGRAHNVSIYMVEGENAVLKSSKGYPRWFIEKVRKIPYPKGFTWKTIIEGKARYVDNVDEDKAIGKAGRDVGTKSYVSIPLKHEQRVVGVININSFSSEAFTRDEINFFESMRNHVEIAISNAKQVQTIRKNEKIFSSFMNNLPGVAFIKDMEGKYVFINRNFEQQFGIDPEEVTGKTDKDLCDTGLSEQFM